VKAIVRERDWETFIALHDDDSAYITFIEIDQRSDMASKLVRIPYEMVDAIVSGKEDE
jgi:hypothetical protein